MGKINFIYKGVLLQQNLIIFVNSFFWKNELTKRTIVNWFIRITTSTNLLSINKEIWTVSSILVDFCKHKIYINIKKKSLLWSFENCCQCRQNVVEIRKRMKKFKHFKNIKLRLDEIKVFSNAFFLCVSACKTFEIIWKYN